MVKHTLQQQFTCYKNILFYSTIFFVVRYFSWKEESCTIAVEWLDATNNFILFFIKKVENYAHKSTMNWVREGKKWTEVGKNKCEVLERCLMMRKIWEFLISSFAEQTHRKMGIPSNNETMHAYCIFIYSSSFLIFKWMCFLLHSNIGNI
jgi:hypothetical protein